MAEVNVINRNSISCSARTSRWVPPKDSWWCSLGRSSSSIGTAISRENRLRIAEGEEREQQKKKILNYHASMMENKNVLFRENRE